MASVSLAALDTNNAIVLPTESLRRARIICQHVARFVALPIASQMAGVSWDTARAWKRHAPQFAEMLEAAETERKHKLEAEAWRRSLNGSDLLLMFMLKAADPTLYERQQKIELTGPGGAPLELNDPQRAARVAAILAAIVAKRAVTTDAPVIEDAEFTEVIEPTDYMSLL